MKTVALLMLVATAPKQLDWKKYPITIPKLNQSFLLIENSIGSVVGGQTDNLNTFFESTFYLLKLLSKAELIQLI